MQFAPVNCRKTLRIIQLSRGRKASLCIWPVDIRNSAICYEGNVNVNDDNSLVHAWAHKIQWVDGHCGFMWVILKQRPNEAEQR